MAYLAPNVRSAPDCKCKICNLYTITFRSNLQGKCQLCQAMRSYKITEDQLVDPLPPEIVTFLGMTKICVWCVNTINTTFQRKLKLCWGTVSYEVVKLVIVRVLKDHLAGEAYRDVWRKSVTTRDLNTGGDLVPWQLEMVKNGY